MESVKVDSGVRTITMTRAEFDKSMRWAKVITKAETVYDIEAKPNGDIKLTVKGGD